MADYETHANKAQEILGEIPTKALQRSESLAIAAAQVQAILALAAAIDSKSRSDGDGPR